MIRKVAVVVGVLAALVLLAWVLKPRAASLGGCKFEFPPQVAFNANRLHVGFVGRFTGDFFYEAQRAVFGGFDHEVCMLGGSVSFEGPVEPGSFPIDGVLNGASFSPSSAHHPKIKAASIDPINAIGVPLPPHAVHGKLTLERVTASELAGRLELECPELGSPWGSARISTPFSVRLGPNGESVDTGY